MFDGQTINLIALMDLFFILVSYIIMKLVFKLANKWIDDAAAEPDPRWNKLEKLFEKLHATKILLLGAASLIARANVEIISGALASNMQPIDIFGKINLLLVADVIAIMFVLTSKLVIKGEGND